MEKEGPGISSSTRIRADVPGMVRLCSPLSLTILGNVPAEGSVLVLSHPSSSGSLCGKSVAYNRIDVVNNGNVRNHIGSIN